MVTVVIDREYLHYTNPELARACQIKGEQKAAFCRLLPDGMHCNVISWECLDIRNLRLDDEMGPSYREFYKQSMSLLKKYQKEERKCLEDVKNIVDEINEAKQYYTEMMSKSLAHLISGASGIHAMQDKSSKVEEENASNKQLALSPSDPTISFVNTVVNIQVIVGVFYGSEICHNDNLEIHLLPPIRLVGFVEVEIHDMT